MIEPESQMPILRLRTTNKMMCNSTHIGGDQKDINTSTCLIPESSRRLESEEECAPQISIIKMELSSKKAYSNKEMQESSNEVTSNSAATPMSQLRRGKLIQI